MLRHSLFALVASVTLIACYSEARVGARVHYAAPAPDLVYVSPGVQVIADYDYPVFYASNVYWRYDGGVWYRSRSYRGGWVVTRSVPVAVRRIDRPTAYVHYHGHGKAVASGRDHRRPRGRGPVVRDHRH